MNGYPDFTVRPPSTKEPLLLECKNVRDDDYRKGGVVVAHRVEIQKTRAAKSDPNTRYYDAGYFHMLAVCLGKKTGKWSDFLFVKADDLARHEKYPGKLAVMHRVPLPESVHIAPWYRGLDELLKALQGVGQ